jgi:hypothetical protein
MEDAEPYRNFHGTAVIAALRYVNHGYRPTHEEMPLLLKVVRDPNERESDRGLALITLEDLEFEGLEALLLELADDPSPDIRFDANMRLLRRGHATRDKLRADLDLLPHVDHGVEQLWAYRDRLNLTPDEESMLRARKVAKMEYRRGVCRSTEEHPYNTALILFNDIKSGLPHEETDIDLIGESALYMQMNRDRLSAVKAVAWFDNEKSREWLARLSSQDERPAVRNLARRLLKQRK